MPCFPGCNPPGSPLTQNCTVRQLKTATGGSFSWVDNEISWGDLVLRTGSIVTNCSAACGLDTLELPMEKRDSVTEQAQRVIPNSPSLKKLWTLA